MVKKNLEADMYADSIIGADLKNDALAREYYAALCNVEWREIPKKYDDPNEHLFEKLKGVESALFSCTWRYAGGIIAQIRDGLYKTGEDYLDFYCSGKEGIVSDRVLENFQRLGWEPVSEGNDII